MGEKSDALEPFHPDRVASRILGMGDVLTLVCGVLVTLLDIRDDINDRLPRAK